MTQIAGACRRNPVRRTSRLSDFSGYPVGARVRQLVGVFVGAEGLEALALLVGGSVRGGALPCVPVLVALETPILIPRDFIVPEFLPGEAVVVPTVRHLRPAVHVEDARVEQSPVEVVLGEYFVYLGLVPGIYAGTGPCAASTLRCSPAAPGPPGTRFAGRAGGGRDAIETASRWLPCSSPPAVGLTTNYC